jgi:hypothetical protein
MDFTQFSLFTRRCALVAITIGLAASAAAIETVAITEYMSDTKGSEATGEWVELYNYGSSTVTMTGWHLKDEGSDNMTLPSGTQIGAHDFLILARDKATFESMWLGGVANSRVVQYGSGTLAMSNTGGDELVLQNASLQTVWQLAYASDTAHAGRATYYALDDLATTNTLHGSNTGAKYIRRNGNDDQTGRLDYEGNEFTQDPYAYSGGGDWGSPLSGAYAGATNPVQPTSWTVDAAAPGAVLNPGVRGLAIADQALDRHDNSDQTGIIPSLTTAEGSALRGVSGGLNADIYDWRNRNGGPRPTTLEFMRDARDHNETLYVTANIRGLTIPDPDNVGKRVYYTSDTATLANVAAQWVRYTNHIVPTYHQGDTISDTEDADIMNSLTWSSSYVNEFGTHDDFTTLTAAGEDPVAPIKYWEIGNEPLVSLANAYQVTNAYTFNGSAGDSTYADYVDRYIAITTAMIAEDPTIKVGPCIVNGKPGANEDILTTLLQSSAHIDFISYHPYGSMDDYLGEATRQEEYLSGVYAEQYTFLQQIKDLVATYRPSEAATMQYVASETNVSNWPSNNNFQEATMSHALGSVETVLSFGRLGLQAAHYWIWITAVTTQLNDWNRYPVTMGFEKMRDELGDKLLGSFDSNIKVHAYVVRNSDTGIVRIWALNFSNTNDIPFHFSLTNAPSAANAHVTKEVLQAVSGPTNLFSVNLPPEQNGGTARRDVDWTSPVELTGADPANLDVTLPAATLTVISVENLNPSAVKEWRKY